MGLRLDRPALKIPIEVRTNRELSSFSKYDIYRCLHFLLYRQKARNIIQIIYYPRFNKSKHADVLFYCMLE